MWQHPFRFHDRTDFAALVPQKSDSPTNLVAIRPVAVGASPESDRLTMRANGGTSLAGQLLEVGERSVGDPGTKL